MADKVTTVAGGRFPVQDITHVSKRTQQGNLRKAQGFVEHTEEVPSSTRVPQNPTLERSIAFFEENAKGEYASLYSRTALWLRTLLSAKRVKEDSREAANEDEEILPF